MANKYLVISGGSRGIGFATIQKFIACGYKAINLSRSAPRLEGVTHITADFTDIGWAEKCGTLIDDAIPESAEIVLIHNSGVLLSDNVENVSAEQLQRVMQVNVIAASQLNQLLISRMEKGSSILYVASTLGEKAVANTCSYVASKHAMIGLMKSTSQDLFGRGIHTAALCPGFTETEMLNEHIGNDNAVVESIVQGVSFGRLIEPEEMAASLWFASQNPVINGSVIHANLGQKEY